MTAHPYAALFPVMSDAEIRSLADDIKEHGQHDPIITLSGEILDGRNRYMACELAKREPWLQAYQGDDPLAFVIGQNLHRRHLTESQRAMVAARLANMKEGAPSGNQNAAKTTRSNDQVVSSGVSRAQAGKMLNAGDATVGRARRIQKNGAPELIAAVDSGRVKVNTAITLLELPQGEQREIVAGGDDAIAKRTAELRGGAKSRILPPPKNSKRLPPYLPTDSPEIWQQARLILDRILPADKHRVRILREVIDYCEARLTKNI